MMGDGLKSNLSTEDLKPVPCTPCLSCSSLTSDVCDSTVSNSLHLKVLPGKGVDLPSA